MSISDEMTEYIFQVIESGEPELLNDHRITKAMLAKALKQRMLSVRGTKSELIERLAGHFYHELWDVLRYDHRYANWEPIASFRTADEAFDFARDSDDEQLWVSRTVPCCSVLYNPVNGRMLPLLGRTDNPLEWE